VFSKHGLTYQNLPQYEIYLFECILLCCKEVTALKVKDKKDKTKSTGPKPRNKNAKLQLKGRIFMTNVTDVVAISKTGKPRDWKSSFSSSADEAGSYTVQIWWKGDPGVENFMIKFQNEEMMKKWAAGLDQQRKESAPVQTTSPDQPPANFAWMQTVNGLENPYAQQQDDDDDDETYGNTPTTSFYNGTSQAPPPQQAMAGTMPRNGSSASLRVRSATQDSQTLGGMARAPPPRFALPQPPAALSLQTQMGMTQQSPSIRQGPDASSYFSPTAESPASSRTSQASGFFGQSAGFAIPKVGTPQPGGWGSVEEHQRYTAPAMPRAPSRDGPSPVNAYGMISANGRGPRGPSMPVMSSNAASQLQQQRSRSYSTPDINGQQANARRQNGQSVPAVPGIPAHLAHERHDSTIPRSNTGSPANELPIRSSTQSPGLQRERQKAYGGTMAQFPAQPVYPRQSTPSNGVTNLPPPGPPPPGIAPLPPVDLARTMSPALANGTLPTPNTAANSDFPLPTQLKVKVNCDSGNYVTLVVAFNITYQSLIDRIDAKLNRFTSSSIGKGNLKLRYQDEDGDFITISSDDDIQIAISEWREGMRDAYSAPTGVGEIELFCVGPME
jgi:cell division control protein 24